MSGNPSSGFIFLPGNLLEPPRAGMTQSIFLSLYIFGLLKYNAQMIADALLVYNRLQERHRLAEFVKVVVLVVILLHTQVVHDIEPVELKAVQCKTGLLCQKLERFLVKKCRVLVRIERILPAAHEHKGERMDVGAVGHYIAALVKCAVCVCKKSYGVGQVLEHVKQGKHAVRAELFFA